METLTQELIFKKKYFLSHYLPKKLYLVYSTSNNLFNAKEQFFTFKFHMRNYPFIILEPSLAELGKKSFLWRLIFSLSLAKKKKSD